MILVIERETLDFGYIKRMSSSVFPSLKRKREERERHRLREMEEHINPLAVTHLLQHTLRSLCIHEDSQWVYAVFWRILPRNYPPPK